MVGIIMDIVLIRKLRYGGFIIDVWVGRYVSILNVVPYERGVAMVSTTISQIVNIPVDEEKNFFLVSLKMKKILENIFSSINRNET